MDAGLVIPCVHLVNRLGKCQLRKEIVRILLSISESGITTNSSKTKSPKTMFRSFLLKSEKSPKTISGVLI